jgi:hypothetical protein
MVAASRSGEGESLPSPADRLRVSSFYYRGWSAVHSVPPREDTADLGDGAAAGRAEERRGRAKEPFEEVALLNGSIRERNLGGE